MKIVRSYVEGAGRPQRVTAVPSDARVDAVKRAHEEAIRGFYGAGTRIRHVVVVPTRVELRVGMTVKQVEDAIVRATIADCDGCVTAAAAILGRSRRHVHDRAMRLSVEEAA